MILMTPPRGKVVRIARRAGPPEPPGLVEVHRAQDQTEALVVKGLLEAHGIACVLRTHIVQSVYPFSVADLGAIRILVNAPDHAEATRVLAARRQS